MIDKELFAQQILVHAAYLTAFDWFCENAGRTPNVDEQAKMVLAIVRSHLCDRRATSCEAVRPRE